jgi:hypothetical protein
MADIWKNARTKKASGLLGSASEVWEFLQEHGGIDLKSYREGNYDQSLELALLKALEPSAGSVGEKDLNALLKTGVISVEQFLVEFFKAVQPFSDMMSDLLRMFEKAGIKDGNANMDVRFNFDEKSDPLDFDLEHFRKWQEIWQRIAGTFLVNLWTYDALWDVNGAVRLMEARVSDPQMRRWLELYRGSNDSRGRFAEVEPPAPKSAVAELDRTLERLWRLWLAVVRESKRYGPEREELATRWQEMRDRTRAAPAEPAGELRRQDGPRYPSEEYRELWPLEMLAHLDSDLWAFSLAQGAYARAEEIQQLPEAERRKQRR